VTTVAEERVDRPLRSYSLLVGLFVAVFGGILGRAAARRELPERVPVFDIALAGVAAHKLSRLVAKDEVTSVVRAPFVDTVADPAGDVREEPSGGGARRAVGRLLTCPSCVGQWAAATFVTGTLVAPRLTRSVAAIFAADAVSDFLHVAYRAGKTRA
jgi:hypothetical protein